MDKDNIRFVGDLQRLELKPGDRFILTVDGRVSLEMHNRIQQLWKSFVGGDTEEFRLLILDGGMKLGVINGEPA